MCARVCVRRVTLQMKQEIRELVFSLRRIVDIDLDADMKGRLDTNRHHSLKIRAPLSYVT